MQINNHSKTKEKKLHMSRVWSALVLKHNILAKMAKHYNELYINKNYKRENEVVYKTWSNIISWKFNYNKVDYCKKYYSLFAQCL